MPWKTVPPDWQLSPELRQWTRDKGLSEAQIDEELESFRDHDYKTAKIRPDSCWRNWIKGGIKRGWIHVTKTPTYRRPEPVTEEMRLEDQRSFENDPKIAQFLATKRK